MVSSEEFGRLLSPFLHHLKKMELELTCPTCSNLLSQPTLLPCNHIFCSQCITAKDEHQNACPVCISTFLCGDIRHSIHMETMVNIFKSMDAAISIVQKLGFQFGISGMKLPSKGSPVSGRNDTEKKFRGPQIDTACIKVPSKDNPVLRQNSIEEDLEGSQVDLSGKKVFSVETFVSNHNNTKGKLQDSQVDISIMKVPSKESFLSGHKNTEEILQGFQFDISGMKVSPKESPVSGNNSTKEEELACNMFEGQSSNVQSCPPVSGDVNRFKPRGGGGSDELVTFGREKCVHNAGKEAFVNQEKLYSPPSFGAVKNSETNNNQGNGHGTERLPREGSPRKDTEVGTNVKIEVALLPWTDPFTCETQNSEKSTDVKRRIPTSPSEVDDVRKAKRQKSQSEHGSNTNNQPLNISNHSYTEAAAECAFCHSFRITEFTGPMLHYVNGKPAAAEEVNQSNVTHFHQKCFEWAPRAFFDGETAKNMEDELSRASKIKCSKCGLKGAALGCYVESCWRSYHVPCAIELPGCRWDCKNFNMLCPSHSSRKLPCDKFDVKWKIKAKRSSLLCDKSKTTEKKKAKYSSSTQIDRFILPGQLASIPEECNELWTAAPGVCSEWIICRSMLATSEMVLLDKFASLTGAFVTGMWKQNVTHVIASTDKHGACSRTVQVLMAILSGKWVLTMDWVKACMEARHPVAEEPYEIGLDVCGVSNGPKNGRLRALVKAPRIFTGSSFYFGEQFKPPYKGFLEELVLAAGGTVLEEDDLISWGSKAKVSSPGSSYIVYNEDLPETYNSVDLEEVVRKRCDEVVALATMTGFKVIGHLWLLDNIAACNSATDLEKGVVQ